MPRGVPTVDYSLLTPEEAKAHKAKLAKEARDRRRAADPEAYDKKIREAKQQHRVKQRANGTGDPNGVSWARQNRDKVNERRNTRYAEDVNYRILQCLRARLYVAFRNGQATKPATTLELTGCTPEALIAHLAAQFAPGMTLANYGEWEIDHIRPCHTFDLTDLAQVTACFHYTNFQPLWQTANRQKRGLVEAVTRASRHTAASSNQ